MEEMDYQSFSGKLLFDTSNCLSFYKISASLFKMEIPNRDEQKWLIHPLD